MAGHTQRQGPIGIIQAILVMGGLTCWLECTKRWCCDSEPGKGAGKCAQAIPLRQEVWELSAGAEATKGGMYTLEGHSEAGQKGRGGELGHRLCSVWGLREKH